jgi:bifunctional DNase/RNase
MIEVIVSRLGHDSSTNSYVVVLQERGGTRLLPIWIGRPEAESIVRHMHNVKGERPGSHDLVRSIILGLGAELHRVQITRVEKSIYFAELHLRREDSRVHVDARPSDSIAIALRLSAPIFAADDLLVEPDDDESEGDVLGEGDAVGDADAGDLPPTLREGGDITELSSDQLKAYLENLRPEDFGKFNP